MHRDPNCKLCLLHKTAQFVCLLGKGPEPCDIMIVGEAPGRREDDSGKPFVGKSGQLLDDMLEKADLDRRDMFITNAVSCRPPDNRTPKKKEIEACKKWLKYQFAMIKPRFVLLLGNVALQAVLGITGIRKARGKPVEKNGMVILPTFHPSAALYDPRVQGIIEKDLASFKEIIDFGGIPEERNLNFTIVDTWKKFKAMLPDLVGAVSFDTEDTGLYPWDREVPPIAKRGSWARKAAIVSMGFGTRDHQYIIPVAHPESVWSQDDIDLMWDDLGPALEDCELVTHAGKFDALWVLVENGVKIRLDFDTMLAHYLLDENSLHDLEFLSGMYFGAPKYDIPLAEKQGMGPLDRHAKYLAADVYYTRRLRFRLGKELEKDQGVKRVFYKLMMPYANMFVDIEHRGLYIDLEKMGDAEDFLKDELDKAQRQFNKWGKGVNMRSPKQLGKLFFEDLGIPIIEKTAKGAPSTSESVLKRIDHPAAGALIKFRGAAQQLSFFIEGWKPYIINNRLHPSFKLHGTVTGRPSCEHPNLQQTPRDKRIRSLIIAPPGYDLLEADLSQIELRLAADAADERALLDLFRRKKDAHWMTCITSLERGGGEKKLVINTAKHLIKTGEVKFKGEPDYADAIDLLLLVGPKPCEKFDEAWKELRKKAKAINFGYLYGMWWKKFKIYARDNYDIIVTDEEAQESRTMFFDLFSDFPDWHDKQRRYARYNGFVRSLAGRKRRLPAAMQQQDTPERREAERQSINSPIQSFASEINLMVCLQLREEFPPKVIYIVGTIHDALLIEVRKDYTQRVAKRLLEIMTGPRLFKDFDIELNVPIEGEVKIGAWGSGKDFNPGE